DLALAEPDNEKLRTLFSELEFKSWMAGLDEPETEIWIPSTNIKRQYEIVQDEKSFQQWRAALDAAEIFSLDTETTSLDYMTASVVGVSFSIEEGRAAYVPFGHDYMDAPKQLDKKWVLSQLKP